MSSPIVLKSHTFCGHTPPQEEISVTTMSDTYSQDQKERLIRFMLMCDDRETPEIECGPPACFWRGGVFKYSGYCRMNRNTTRGLTKKGMNVRLSSYVGEIDFGLDQAVEFIQMSKNVIPVNSPLVCGSVASSPAPGTVVHWTMCESHTKVNPSFVNTLNHADEIWVPTDWQKKQFESEGVKPPIRTMPLGVDPDIYKPSKTELIYSSGTKSFVFLSCFAWSWRKKSRSFDTSICESF